jgi:hypothetical protein
MLYELYPTLSSQYYPEYRTVKMIKQEEDLRAAALKAGGAPATPPRRPAQQPVTASAK